MTRAAAQRARTRESRKHARPGLAYRPVPPGVVEAERADDQWWLVAIGRDRGVKRFSLTRGEAAELVRVLRERVLTLDGGES
jgi:hypothetical protein